MSFYNQGVDANPTDEGILGALFLNRAACNLELRKEMNILCGTRNTVT